MKIAIDAGHGSNTAGKRTAPFTKDVDIDKDGKVDIKKGEQYREHYANVMVASKLAKELESYGFDIVKTGWNDDNAKDDVDVSILDRQAFIRKSKCDYAISIHFNASNSNLKQFDSAEGVSVYVREEKELRGESDKLAQCVLQELLKGTKQRNRGICTGKLGLCNATGMNVKGAILVELAFMTNEREAQELMASEAYCNESAEEIARGLIKHITGEIDVNIITLASNRKSIMWLQIMLNKKLGTKLKIDGDYGINTSKAVLQYFRSMNWSTYGKTGYFVGAGTIKALLS